MLNEIRCNSLDSIFNFNHFLHSFHPKDNKKLTSNRRHSAGDRKHQANSSPLFKTPPIPTRKAKKIIKK